MRGSTPGWMPTPADTALVLVLAAIAVWEIPSRASDPNSNVVWLVLTTALCVVPLLWRVSLPLPSMLVVAGAFAAYPLPTSDAPEVLVQALGLLVAVYSVAAHANLRESVIGLVVATAAGLSRSLALEEYDTPSAVVNAAWAIPAWVLGRLVQGRDERARTAEQLAVSAKLDAEALKTLAVQHERERIARELHDVVAHAVTIMVLQARGGRRALDGSPAVAREAFDAVEHLGTEALAELRRLLSLLPTDVTPPDPLPGLSGTDELVAQARAAGLDISLQREGEDCYLPAAADFSAYRVLQELITNALRYAAPGPTVARLCHRPEGVEIEVRNPVDDSEKAAMGTGAGLLGARARVAVFGGSLCAQREGAEFVVRATVPKQQP